MLEWGVIGAVAVYAWIKSSQKEKKEEYVDLDEYDRQKKSSKNEVKEKKTKEKKSTLLDKYENKLLKAHRLLTETTSGKEYITKKQKINLLEQLVFVNQDPELSDRSSFEDDDLNKKLWDIKSKLYKLDFYVETSNQNYAHRMARFYPDVFSDKGNNLTNSQTLSTVSEEPNTLLVAGAGSGKTSSIVGRVKYLQKVKKINPENILVITFSEDTKNELQERLGNVSGLEIRTFHSLGLKFIKMYDEYSNANESIVSDLALSKLKFKKFLDFQIDELFKNEKQRKALEKHFISYLKPYKSVFDESFTSIKDYVRYMKDNGIMRTLNGDTVRSFEEFEISNFLYLNGIKYIYEKPYTGNIPEPEDGIRRRQYKPDFYLVDYDIYIEHFAIDKDGNPPPHWFETNYVAQMKWKRELHKNNKTKLIETYSYERMQNRLIEGLEQKLNAESVQFKSMDKDELLRIFNEDHMMNRFTTIMVTFLNHFKSNECSLPTLKAKAGLKMIYDSSRELSFLNIFEFILNAYNHELAATNPPKIDFIDMIIKAKNYLEKDSKLVLNYEHIIVDEFQDISTATFNFLKTIRRKSPKSKLFAVGDDWQSIYQFLGSNVGFFTEFEQSISNSREETIRVNLSDTFRFHQNIADITSEFIMKNKKQLTKTIKSEKNLLKDSVEIIFSNKKGLLDDLIKNIYIEDPKASIMIIGRYKNNNLVSHLKKHYKNQNISYKTVHKSKGLEADYVILNEVKSGFLGFPSEIVDDPILNLVTNAPPNESINFPEERRLFYVALTRAKKKVKIVADDRFKSVFLSEIEKNDLVLVSKDKFKPPTIYCPACEEGEMQLRKNQIDDNYFFGCSNYPVCVRTLRYDKNIHDDYYSYLQKKESLLNKIN